MGRKETNKSDRHSSVLVGAIFMCNRRTKKECFERKLFGFPYNQADFVKKVKTGMVLFLFEYEERKLHGVFEATSDGAENIVPAAFTSSGRLYPSQICFKRTWSCKPLSEDEFRNAIKENYYEPFKFNFGLSYEQVSKLIYLFSLKKTSVQPYWRERIPNKTEEQFDDTVRGARKPWSLWLNSHEQHKSILASENFTPDSHHGLFHKVPYSGTKSLFGFMSSESQNDSSLKSNFSLSMSNDQVHTIPSHGVDLSSSITQGMVSPFYKDLTAYSRPSADTLVPHIRNQSPLQSDPNTFNMLPASSYQSMFLFNSEEAKKDTSFPIYESTRISIPDLGYSSCATLQDNQAYSPDYYIPPVVKSVPLNEVVAPKCTESFLPLVESSGNSNQLAAIMEYTVREQQHHNVGSAPDYIPLSVEYDDLSESKFDIDSEEDAAPDLLIMHDENYRYSRPVPNSRLRSDFERRKSVFTRLSSAPRLTCQSNIIHEYEASPSADQLLSILSQRRDLWGKTSGTTVGVPNMTTWSEQEVPETTSEKELSKADLGSELDSSGEAVAGECFQLPFRDFKRRSSKVLKMESGSETHVIAESNKNEGSERKRRRLVRPSFNEEEHRSLHTEHNSVQISAEIIESDALVKEDVVTKDEHFQTENASSANVSTNNLQINSKELQTCKNDVSGINMEGLLLESSAQHPTISNTFSVEGPGEDVDTAEVGSSEQSVLPGGSDTGGRKVMKWC